MKKKEKEKKKSNKFMIALRVYDDELKDYKHEIFEFRSKKAQTALKNICEKHKIDCVTKDF